MDNNNDCKFVEIVNNSYFHIRYCKSKEKYCTTTIPVSNMKDAIKLGCYGGYEKQIGEKNE